MAGQLKHRFPSPVPDEGIATEVGPDEWNDGLVMSEGNDGDIPVRRTALTYGWELIKLGASMVFVNVTQAANSGTGETDLHVFPLTAGHFAVNKKGIRLIAQGSFAANANVKTLRLKFGALSVTLNPTTGSPNGKRFEVVAEVWRTGSNAQMLFVRTLLESIPMELLSKPTATETDSGAITLKLTGQSGTASSDILLDKTSIEFLN